jgi:diguanylate cyclase (GGDEF)-like protein
MEAQRIGVAQDELTTMRQVRLELVSLPTLEIDLSNPHTDTHRHEQLHAYIVELLSQLNQLELAKTVQDVDALTSVYQQNRAAFLARTQPADKQSPEVPTETALMEIQDDIHQLFILQRRNLQIHNNIDSFIEELNGQILQLTLLTTEHVNSVFSRFYQSATLVIDRERLTLYLTMLLMACAIILLFILHKLIVTRGFGNRLSLISRAMASSPGEATSRNLPLTGQDEITDMARALDVLLDKAMQLRDLAIMDELTQVYNRRRFFELASSEANRAARKKSTTILLMIDLDHFKSCNDTYGHNFGDKVLRETAQACRSAIRTMDVFARYGGEEFAALMPETELKDGLMVAERIRQTIASMPLITDNGLKVHITLSIGLVETDLSMVTVEQSMKHADSALYQAKIQGRNRVAIWQPSE